MSKRSFRRRGRYGRKVRGKRISRKYRMSRGGYRF